MLATKSPSKKKRSPLATSTLTRHYWENLGWRVAFVERYVRRGAYRQKFDAWGFADHIAFQPQGPGELSSGILALQSCAWKSMTEHLHKILVLRNAREFLQCGNRICVMGWKRNKKPGWPACRRTEWVKLEHFEQLLARRPVTFLTCEIDPYGLCYLKGTGGRRIVTARDFDSRVAVAATEAWACNESARAYVPKPSKRIPI